MEEVFLAANWIDAVVGVIVLFCMLMGLLSGMVMQVASILGVATGVILSMLFSGTVATVISPRWIEDASVARLVASFACFFGGAGGVRLIAAFFSGLIKKISLERFDRLLGLFFGFFKGVFISAVILLIAGRCGVESVKMPVRESLTGGILVESADYLVSLVSGNGAVEDATGAIREKLGKIRSGLKEREDAVEEANEGEGAR